MSRQNGLTAASTKDGTDSKNTGRYVPPHERRRMEEASKESDNRSYRETEYSRFKEEPKRPWENKNLSRSGGLNRSGEIRREDSFTNLNTSGSKWNDKGYTNYQYGEDGLLPRNMRLENELFTETSTGINFEKYEDLPVEKEGTDIPESLENFLDCDLGPVLNNCVRLLNFSVPTPVQKNAIPIVMNKRDLMACAQTGSGKTAAFLFPIVADLLNGEVSDGRQEVSGSGYRRSYKVYPSALILAPTRELAGQIHLQARKFTYRSHLKSVVVYGGAEFRTQIAELERGCHILVATPGRLLDMIERGKVGISQIKYLCIDEADKMLDMGFEQQIRSIVEVCPEKGVRQTLMFSATFPKSILRLAEDFLDNFIFLKVGRIGSTTDFIKQTVRWVEDHEKKGVLLDLLSTVDGLTLVFVETKRMADHLEEFLYNKGFSAASIHGDRLQNEREAALEAFRKGQAKILVATDVAARGLDVNNIKHVINYDLPNDIDDYIHRIGRTGRAGNEGLATAFFNDKNRNISRDLFEILEECGQESESWLHEVSNQYSHRGTRYTGRGGRGGRNTGSGGNGGRTGAAGGRGSGTGNGSGTGSGSGGSRYGTTATNTNTTYKSTQVTPSYGGNDGGYYYSGSSGGNYANQTEGSDNWW